MTSIHPSSRQTPTRTGAVKPPITGWRWPADWAAQHMAVAAEQAQALFRGLNAMRAIQEQSVREVAERHAAAAKRFQGVQPGTDVLALQAEFLRQDFDGAARCAQQLTATALETGAELFACGAHLVNTEDAFETATRLVHG